MDKSMPAPPPVGFQVPPPPYHPETQPAQPNVIIVGTPAFGSETQRMTCPYCHSTISTTVESEANTRTHLFALLLCAIGLWCCVPCPYCMDSCMSKKHYCPNCKAFLGQSDG